MKPEYIVLIVIIAAVIGYALFYQKQKNEPINKNTARVTSDLQSELSNIDNWLGGKPNTSDPNYQATFNKYTDRRKEIVKILSDMYGCATTIDPKTLICQ